MKKKAIIFMAILFNIYYQSISQDMLNPSPLPNVHNSSVINRANFFVKGWNWDDGNESCSLIYSI